MVRLALVYSPLQHEPSRIVDIDFVQPKHGKEHLQDKVQNPAKRQKISPTKINEQKGFIDGLQSLSPRSSILSVTTLRYGPQLNTSVARSLPPTIMSLQHIHYEQLTKNELEEKCEEILQHGLKISQHESEYLSEATRLQADSLLWFEYRKGRITASQFGPVFRTNIDSPSQSLVKRIMQQVSIPKAAALEWGKTHEPQARKECTSAVQSKHTLFKVEMTGLHINPQYPHLGASPDGLISCACCGDGLLEIKWPYSKRNEDPEVIADSSFYLKPTEDGLKLFESHDYYHQVQGQMAICKRSYCDFVCWTPHGMHTERIKRNPVHFQHIKPSLDRFFMRIILPRVLCRAKNTENENCGLREVYCFCREGEHGDMIACENPSCKYIWFHFNCVNITSIPSGDWYCPECM